MNLEGYRNNVESDDREDFVSDLISKLVDEHSRDFIGPKEKISIFMGGGSGSGKSTVRASIMEQFDNPPLVIDADTMKALIPEYKDLKRDFPLETDSWVHKESSEMAAAMFTAAVEKEMALLFDGTLKSWKKYLRYFKRLRKSGYEITLVIVDIPVEEAIRRAKARYEQGILENGVGRRVDEEIIRESHKKIPDSFLNLKNAVDEWIIYANSREEFTAIAQCENGIETIWMTKEFEAFLNKGNI